MTMTTDTAMPALVLGEVVGDRVPGGAACIDDGFVAFEDAQGQEAFAQVKSLYDTTLRMRSIRCSA